MKFLTFMWFEMAKAAEMAKASDKVMASLPPGVKMLASYVCQAVPFPGLPPDAMVGISIAEVDSNEDLAAVSYPLQLAGAVIHRVPVLELPVGGAAEVEKKYSG